MCLSLRRIMYVLSLSVPVFVMSYPKSVKFSGVVSRAVILVLMSVPNLCIESVVMLRLICSAFCLIVSISIVVCGVALSSSVCMYVNNCLAVFF